jgi:hypothetical protein
MTDIIPEGTLGAGEDEKVVLTKVEHDKMVDALASDAEAKARLLDEVTDLRKKNRELVTKTSPELKPEDVSKAVAEEFKKRELEDIKKASEDALAEFMDAHQEFSKESDPDGSKFSAFQKALARINLSGVKTKSDYIQVLDDALRLTGQVSSTTMPNFSSTPRSSTDIRGVAKSAQLLPAEQKLVSKNFNGDAEAYLKVKAKRPEYIDELLKWVR